MALTIYDDNIICEGSNLQCRRTAFMTINDIIVEGEENGNIVTFEEIDDQNWHGRDTLYGAVYNISLADLD